MKICPFCKAEIEDNARFCLYCMTPLNQKEVITPRKQKLLWWPFAVVGVLLFALVVLLLLPDKKTPQKPTVSTTMPTAATTTASTEIPTVEPTAEPTGESTEGTAESYLTESTVTSATEADPNPTGTQATRPRPTVAMPNSRPTTAPTYKPASGSASVPTYKPVTGSTSAPTYKPATGSTTAQTYKPATGSTSVPTYKPTTGSTSAHTVMPATKPTSVAATTTQPTSGATTAPTYKPVTGPTSAPTSKPATEATTVPAYNPTTGSTSAPTTIPTTAPTTAPTTSPPATVDVSKIPQYDWEHPITSTSFRYRRAVQADVLGLDYQVTGNDIVITDVEDCDDSGFIQIPSYINGKRVIALSSATFCEGVPEAIYLSDTLLALHSGVFVDFRPNLYVSGEVLAVEDSTEPWRKIFTTKTCVNQYGENFSNFSGWQEWSAQTYVYRTATPDDVGDPNYQNTDGDIVITGIDTLREDYIYDIPAYIDGKKVVAIGEWALSATYAIAIYVPDTVRCIGQGAFNYCVHGADIYFRGDSIYAPSNPFDYDSYVILHCSATCRNADKGYYKDLAKGYNVTWKEWNG